MLYLNHAGTSWPKPPEVLEATKQTQEAPPTDWPEIFETGRASVAGSLGCSPDSLLITPGCTSALAIAVADVPWQPGDVVLTSSMEHHALWRPLSKLASRGVRVIEAPRAEQGPIDVSAVARLLDSEPVRLLAVSMASNVTGELLPVAELIGLARASDTLILLDAAQTAGWIPLNLDEQGADLVAFAGHKGPQAPTGVGGLYVRPGLILNSPSAQCGDEGCSLGPGFCDAGSVNLPALAGLAAGLRHMETASLPQSQRVAEHLRSRLKEGGLAPLGHGPSLPTVALDVPHLSETGARLKARGVIVSTGTQCAPRAHESLGTDGVLRLSFGPGHTVADAELAAREVLHTVQTRPR